MFKVWVTYYLYWFCALFVSLTRWENNVSCLVSTHTTQILACKSGETCIFLSYIWFSDNQFRYLWTRIYSLYCSVYTVLSLSLKAFRVYRTDTKFSSYFCSFRFPRNALLLSVHIQVETTLPGIATMVTSHFSVSWWVAWLLLRRPFLYILAGNSAVHFKIDNDIQVRLTEIRVKFF